MLSYAWIFQYCKNDSFQVHYLFSHFCFILCISQTGIVPVLWTSDIQISQAQLTEYIHFPLPANFWRERSRATLVGYRFAHILLQVVSSLSWTDMYRWDFGRGPPCDPEGGVMLRNDIARVSHKFKTAVLKLHSQRIAGGSLQLQCWIYLNEIHRLRTREDWVWVHTRALGMKKALAGRSTNQSEPFF